MPGIDRCEPAIIKALEKQGWLVNKRSFPIRMPENPKRILFADLQMRHVDSADVMIIVEVKCFADDRERLDEFYRAVGQYNTYYDSMVAQGDPTPIYLAVPMEAYQSLDQIVVKSMTQRLNMRWILIDIEIEEIEAWIN